MRSALYLIALSRSFVSTWVIKLLSAATGGIWPFGCSANRMRFFFATDCMLVMVSRTTSSRRKAILVTSFLSLRSSWVTDRKVSIICDMRCDSFEMICRNSRDSTGTFSSEATSSAKPFMLVSGVRSSCDISEIISLFNRSYSFVHVTSRTRMARHSGVCA